MFHLNPGIAMDLDQGPMLLLNAGFTLGGPDWR